MHVREFIAARAPSPGTRIHVPFRDELAQNALRIALGKQQPLPNANGLDPRGVLVVSGPAGVREALGQCTGSLRCCQNLVRAGLRGGQRVEHRRCVLRARTKNRKRQRLVVREHLAHGVGAGSVVSTKLAARRAWAVQRGRAPGKRATQRPAVRRIGRAWALAFEYVRRAAGDPHPSHATGELAIQLVSQANRRRQRGDSTLERTEESESTQQQA